MMQTQQQEMQTFATGFATKLLTSLESVPQLYGCEATALDWVTAKEFV